MDKATAIDCVRRYAAEVVKELRPEAIIMFGSYAADRADEDSDRCGCYLLDRSGFVEEVSRSREVLYQCFFS